MSELDDLRRVAYGRTSSPEGEAAAAAARAELEARERPVRAPAPEQAPQEPETSDAPGVTLQIVDPSDEPGYLHQPATTWRVWAVPAFATFVFGIAITVASGLLILQLSRTAPSEIVAAGAPVPGLEPGDLERASALLASPQSSEDIPPVANESYAAGTTHALATASGAQLFAAISINGDICITVYGGEPEGSSYGACSPPSSFVVQGLWVESQSDGVSTRWHWDGMKVSETRTLL